MASRLFDKETALPGFEGFHFKIRGWPADKNAEYLNKYMRRISGSLQLIFKKDQNGVAFIKLKREFGETRDSLDRIERLCWAIVNPQNRSHIDRLSDRSLLGFFPLTGEIQSVWNDALFKTALEEGPSYLQAIRVHDGRHGPARLDLVPSWAVILAFAMVSQINVAGCQMVSSAQSTTRPKNEYDRKVASLFGKQGMKTGGIFLKCVVDDNHEAPDLKSVQQAYSDGVRDLENAIQVIFESLGNLIESPRDNDRLSQSCKKAENACYSATICAAKATLANRTVFKEFLEFRLKAAIPTDSSVGVAAVGLFSTAAVSVSAVPASVSVSACWALITTWSWPTVLAVTNPVGGAVVGTIGLAMFMASRFNASRAKEILYHQRLMILISRCYTITNGLVMLLECINYLRKPYNGRTASTFIQRVGNKDLLKSWTEFMDKDDRERKEKLSSQKKGNHHKHRAKTGLNTRQRQVHRYMQALARKERTSLMNSLDRLRGTGKPYKLSESESEGDSSE